MAKFVLLTHVPPELIDDTEAMDAFRQVMMETAAEDSQALIDPATLVESHRQGLCWVEIADAETGEPVNQLVPAWLLSDQVPDMFEVRYECEAEPLTTA